ncbi:hypothetical protein [Thermocoleostomius sinensis]|uniref:Uncharacterized protein n=1 Tax=Thermocoleostomius sinensis A174 TaxID=2016057 RepID=A0A9E9CAW6_9CYAN|nr:hypothetical protein [Thermocoleostomius sinensis]WAL61532.1 hypothetical protein OXH18_05965 [Thermocoleostomius sinensis A174]
MNSTKNESTPVEISPAPFNNADSFDFETWASLVKRQMIACLRKRGAV